MRTGYLRRVLASLEKKAGSNEGTIRCKRVN